MLFNERCPLQMENFTGKGLAIRTNQTLYPQTEKVFKPPVFLSPALDMKRHLYLSVLFFKGRICIIWSYTYLKLILKYLTVIS